MVRREDTAKFVVEACRRSCGFCDAIETVDVVCTGCAELGRFKPNWDAPEGTTYIEVKWGLAAFEASYTVPETTLKVGDFEGAPPV